MKVLLLLIALAGTAQAVGNGTLTATPPVTFVTTTTGTGNANATLQNTSAGALDIELVKDASCDRDIDLSIGGSNPFVLGGFAAKTVTFECTNARIGLERCLVHARDANTREPLADLEGVCDHAMSTGLNASATSLDFGTVVVGSSSTQTLLLTNNGADPFSTLFFQTDELDDNFEIALPCNPDAGECNGAVVPVSPAAQTIAVLHCTPTSPGPHTAHLEIATDNGLHLPAKVTLTCIGAAASKPVLLATPPVVTVATPVEVVSASAQIGVALTNAGIDTLQIQSLRVIGVDPDSTSDWSFSLTGTCTGTPCSLGPGQQVAVELELDPTAIGARAASLLVSYRDTIDRSRSIPLNGVGQGATLQLTRTPAAIELGTVPLGRSTSTTLHFANTGNRDTNAMLGLAPVGPYSLAPPAALTVPPTANADLLATCTATTQGVFPATITASSTDTLALTTIAIAATCTASTSPFYADPGGLDFGEVRVDGGPVTRTAELGATGAPLVLTGTPHLDVANPAISIGAASAAQTPASIDVTVTPSADDGLASHLLVSDTAGDNLSIPIRGKVVTATYNVPMMLELGTFCIGQPTTPSSLTLQSTGTATIQLGAPTLPADANFDLGLTAPSVYPATLLPGKTAVISITPRRQLTVGPIGDTLTLKDTVTWATDVASAPTRPTEVSAKFVSSGAAIAPQVIPFGVEKVHVYSTAGIKSVTIQNCNATVLQLDAPVIRPPFSIDSTGFPTQLAPNESATFTVGFHPTRLGAFADTLTITSPQVAPLVVELTGTSETDDQPQVDAGSDTGPLASRTFYACSCNGSAPGGGLPIVLALAAIIFRRRAGSS